MDQGFSATGELLPSGSEGSVYELVALQGRPILRISGQEGGLGSMYYFGRIACRAIKSSFDWANLLSVLPDPGTTEKIELKAKLIGQWEHCRSFIEEELGIKDFSYESFEAIAESFARLYPSFGHFEDSWSFISDNYYSFEPAWDFQSYHTAPDFRTLVEEAFGCYRKDLAKTVAKSNGSAISLISRFRDSITVEQIISLLNDDRLSEAAGWSFIGANFDSALGDLTAFDRLSPSLRYRLATDLIERLDSDGEDSLSTISIIEDTLTMLRSVPEAELKRFRSDRNWDQIHGRALNLASDEDVEELDPISFPSEIQALDGVVLSGLELGILRTPLEFLRAGSKNALDNCLGKAGYYTKAKNGVSFCLVGEASEKIVAGVELSWAEGAWRVVQLKGTSNRPLAGGKDFEAELLERLNGKAPEQAPKIPRAVCADELEELGPPPRGLRELPQELEPVDVPPFEELAEDEPEQRFVFGEADGFGPLPRELTMRLFEVRMNHRVPPTHFAYPLG